MYLVIPYQCIFKQNNWFFDDKIKNFIYSDETTTVNSVYLTIPFKNDKDYNRKLMCHFKKFLMNLNSKIPNLDRVKLSHHVTITENDVSPVIISLKHIFYSHSQIVVLWERIDNKSSP